MLPELTGGQVIFAYLLRHHLPDLRHLSHNLPDIRRLSRATSSSRLTADSVEKNWVSRNVLHVQQLALWYPLYTMRSELREVVFDVHFYFLFLKQMCENEK